jgi:S-adenosylmethionine-diacylglycerol 3-amino-3-carboxypropyl transferase
VTREAEMQMAAAKELDGGSTYQKLSAAVHRHPLSSMEGVRERFFTIAFRQLVYPQIWEDPIVDMAALDITRQCRLITIASGGCNVASYLLADPSQIIAVDLNASHVALNRLKLAALRHLPGYDAFLDFFGRADSSRNIAAYETFLRPHIDEQTRNYWDGRDFMMRRRIGAFSSGFYRRGLLGRFIGIAHGVSRVYGLNPNELLRADTIEQQQEMFDRRVVPLFDRPLVKWLTDRPASLYGLGIPPSQYRTLLGDSNLTMADVLRERLRRLVCDFPISENYFAWQALGRRYGVDEGGPLPPYLLPESYELVRERAGRVSVEHASLQDALRRERDATLDCYVLLDAQDWMTDADINALWSQITRTARPGARVIFRTAGESSILPGRLADAILSRWHYDEARSRDLARCDRSAIYGGFHRYELRPAA